jgi:hypothetical protein
MLENIKLIISNYLNKRALNETRRAIGDFISGLKSMTDQDLGAILAVSTVIRVNMEDQGYLPKGIYDNQTRPTKNELGRHQMELNKLVRDFNKVLNYTDAVGTLLISYSLRSINISEVRSLGSKMWIEMERGRPHCALALEQGESDRGEPFPKRVWNEHRVTPAALKRAEYVGND